MDTPQAAEYMYLDKMQETLTKGKLSSNRTDDRAIVHPHTVTIQHDWKDEGFPLLTTKKMGIKNIATELEFFIGGITDKKWLQDRNCHIWDSWANSDAVPVPKTDPSYNDMAKETRDLGPIYGYQWRRFGATYLPGTTIKRKLPVTTKSPEQAMMIGDQLGALWLKLQNGDHEDRRMHVSSWNPIMMQYMALPPCHLSFTVTVVDGKLNLGWAQRSADVFLGVPYNIASYAILQYLLAKGSGLELGQLTGTFYNFHIYEHHVKAVEEQLAREPLTPPKLITKNNNLFEWSAEDIAVDAYDHYDAIRARVSV